MRKLNDLYSELRQVHRRLEIDLRGVRDTHELHVDRSERRTLEINTRRRKDPRTSLPIQEHHLPEKVGARVNERARDKSERISMNPAGDIEKQYPEPQRESLRSSWTPRSYNSADSKSYEPLFALAPNHAFSLNRNISREPRKEATRRSRGSSVEHDKNENEGPRPRHI